MEGIRLNGTFGSYRESTAALDIDDDGRNVSVKPGDKVFVSFVSLLVNTYKLNYLSMELTIMYEGWCCP